MTCGTVVDIEMWSDSDFAAAYQWTVDDVLWDFTGHELLMMIRKNPEDAEVFVALDSKPDAEGYSEIMFNDPDVEDGPITTFNIIVMRAQTAQMQPGDYVQSLIMVRPDGLREEIWQGTFRFNIGPTRGDDA